MILGILDDVGQRGLDLLVISLFNEFRVAGNDVFLDRQPIVKVFLDYSVISRLNILLSFDGLIYSLNVLNYSLSSFFTQYGSP